MKPGDSMLFKYYIDVVTMSEQDGTLIPMFVKWKEKLYKVDKVLQVCDKFSMAGGCGKCYQCLFGEQIRNLYWEKDRWFLETNVFCPEIS